MAPIGVTRRWVYDLPPDTLFWSAEAPGEPPIRNEVLSKLTHGDKPMLERVAFGLYYKRLQPNKNSTIELSPAKLWITALGWLAGDGGGLANLIALNRFQWTAQSPCTYAVATLKRRPPTTSIAPAEWVYRNTPHRSGLTWGEVSLLEAVRMWLPGYKFPWEYVIASVYDGFFLYRFPQDIVIRSDAFAAAIPHEKPTRLEARCWSIPNHNNSGPPYDIRLQEVAGALRGAGY